MVTLMNHFAERFPTQAIIRGGMELRLVDCPRFTNDLDYTFIPYSSKKQIQPLIQRAIEELPGFSVTSSMNSKCLRCIVSYRGQKCQIEIHVARECPSVELSTASIARPAGLQGRIIRAMKFEVALSHKLAAWNERALMRDLYDCYFMTERLGVLPDREVLIKRLSSVDLLGPHSQKKKTMTVGEFCKKNSGCAATLTQENIESELRDFLTVDELAGLVFKFRVCINKVVEFFGKA